LNARTLLESWKPPTEYGVIRPLGCIQDKILVANDPQLRRSGASGGGGPPSARCASRRSRSRRARWTCDVVVERAAAVCHPISADADLGRGASPPLRDPHHGSRAPAAAAPRRRSFPPFRRCPPLRLAWRRRSPPPAAPSPPPSRLPTCTGIPPCPAPPTPADRPAPARACRVEQRQPAAASPWRPRLWRARARASACGQRPSRRRRGWAQAARSCRRRRRRRCGW